MKKIFTFFFSLLFVATISAQCVASDFASLQSCFSQTGTVNITVSANITLIGDLVMSNGTTYNITLGAFDVFRGGQMYTDGDVNTKIVVSGKTIVNGSGALTISGLNSALALKSYVVINPVEILYFTSQSVKGGVQLNWATVSEINSSHFILEKSSDAITWTKLAEIKTFNKPTTYSYDDASNISAYYRLSEVGTDGKIEIFKALFVERFASKLEVFPNPSASSVTISSKSKVEIFDSLGRLVRSFDSGTRKIDIENGIYLVKSGSETAKLMIQ